MRGRSPAQSLVAEHDGGCGDDDYGHVNGVGAGEGERLQGLHVAAEAPRDHRLMDLLRQCMGLAEESAGGGRNELARSLVVLDRADRASPAGLVHVGNRAQEQEDVAVGHADDEDEHLRDPQGSQGSQEFHPGRREREQHDEGDRQRDARDDQPCGGESLGGDADGLSLPGPQGNDDVAGGDEGEGRRQHNDSGEDRHEQPYALDEEADRHGRDVRHDEGEGVDDEQDDDVAHHRGRDEQDDQADELGARVDALQEPLAVGDVLAEHHLPQQARAAVERLLDEAALLALPDAPAWTHRHLPLQEPGGRLAWRPYRRLVDRGAGSVEGRHEDVQLPAPSEGTASP